MTTKHSLTTVRETMDFNKRHVERVEAFLRSEAIDGSVGCVDKMLGGKNVHLVDQKDIAKADPKKQLGHICGAMKRSGKRKQRVEVGSWVLQTFRDFEKETRGDKAKVDVVGLVVDEKVLVSLKKLKAVKEEAAAGGGGGGVTGGLDFVIGGDEGGGGMDDDDIDAL